MPPIEPNAEEKLEKLPEDGQTPFSPAPTNPDPTDDTNASQPSSIPDDHPATDSNIDSQELYDEGVSGAAEVSDQSANNAVSAYTDPNTRKDDEKPTINNELL